MPDPDLSQQQRLNELRHQIDAIDNRIHDLLVERADLVVQVGQVKGRQRGDASGDVLFYRPEREARIHRRLAARHHGALPVEALHRIYREIISACLSLEKRLNVVYLGPEATATHEAALKHFGSSAAMSSVASIDDIFHDVEVGRADFGVVPVENAIEGVVIYTLERFIDSPLRICGEVMLPVVYCLMSLASSMEQLRRVYGHARARAQCRLWLERHLPTMPVTVVDATAKGIALVREDEESAVLAGVHAADRYGLNVLSEHVEDRSGHEHRFLVVGRHDSGPSGQDKTSLMFSFRDQPGFLHRILGIFASHGVNLTRIESRPSWSSSCDYLFFVELEGHREQPPVADALAELVQTPGVSVQMLGSYPKRAV
ncbi:MAG: prephenate dehydratase [Magnetococcales bacterium]|nr:prephenate dehydratase [Magnetococcales bacterium]